MAILGIYVRFLGCKVLLGSFLVPRLRVRFRSKKHTVDGRNPAPVDMLIKYFQGFIHVGW